MEKYDVVKLINYDATLFDRGIKEGSMGAFLGRGQGNYCIVLFFNHKNIGEYAIGLVKEGDLEAVAKIPSEVHANIERFLENPHFLENDGFSHSEVREYAQVELIVDRAEYSECGVYKGMRGCVMSSYAFMGAWQVIFSEIGTGRDIADIQVKEKDFRVIRGS